MQRKIEERKTDFVSQGTENLISKAIRYFQTHGLRKTLARTFLEISRRIDEKVAYPAVIPDKPIETLESPHIDLPCTGERVMPTQKNDCFYAHLSLCNFAKDFVPNKVVVDAGCGAGYGTYYLATLGPKMVYGIDVDEGAIQFAKEHYRSPNLIYMQMDCENIGFHEQAFDVVFSSNMIEHLKNYHPFLKTVKEVLSGDGIFILATPPLYGGEPVEDNPFHHTNLTVGEWIDILSGYFTNIETYGHFFMTGKKNKNGGPYVLDFANAPEDCTISEKDFYFEKVTASSYRMRTETLTALFVASGKK